MDEYAHRWANKLLGNNPSTPTIELLYGLASFQFTATTSFALTGADLNAQLNGTPIKPWRSYKASKGDTLSFGAARCGLYAYIAMPSLHCPTQLNSAATVTRDRLGGLNTNGTVLQAGDTIQAAQAVSRGTQTPTSLIPAYLQQTNSERLSKQQPQTIEFIPGYQNADFSEQARSTFTSKNYEVANEISRMGYMLNGEAITPPAIEYPSEPIALGSIQITNSGQPIVLMRDKQTVGGYPKIGCISRLSLGKLAQCPPGAQVRFSEISTDEARTKLGAMLSIFEG